MAVSLPWRSSQGSKCFTHAELAPVTAGVKLEEMYVKTSGPVGWRCGMVGEDTSVLWWLIQVLPAPLAL